MYKICFNGCTISTFEKEDQAIAVALNLHNISNIPHSIFVECDDKNIVVLNRFALPDVSVGST